MNQFLISSAAGCVSGIIAARLFQTPSEQIPGLLAAGLIILAVALVLLSARKTLWPAAFTAVLFLSMANTAWHYDTETPGHLLLAMASPEIGRDVTVEGTVIRPPDLRERYTIVPISVIRLVGQNGLPVPVKRGHIYMKLYASAGDVYNNISYGDRIELRGVHLRKPAAASNPGAFDMRRFLYNQGFFAQVSVREPDQIAIRGHGAGNPLVKVAETIKLNILLTIKKTLPFPESSFLGGVLLGLRSGLSTEIKDTFRAAGVSHVLAVSGLHVTIITLFFMGILNLLRLPRTSCFIIIICALVLFTLITGARPSTVRAAIMNSVTLLFFYFRGIKLDRSFLLGISMAALFILGRNPRLLTEASFLFSFSAVLSLALLTRPIHGLCCKYLRGFFRIFLFLELLIGTAILLIAPSVFATHWEWIAAAMVLLPAGLLADRTLPPFFEFRRWPVWFTTFFAAQIGIQLGMLPLTAFYFKKISVAASMANFIAIPLIGIIVQLGLFAGIIAVIPGIGIWIALILNATNWLCIKLFLATAHFFGTAFPYPDVSPPSPWFLSAYYAALLLLAAWPWIRSNIGPRVRCLAVQWRRPPILVRLAVASVLLLFLAVQTLTAVQPLPPQLTITVLDPAMFFMGGGNAVVIQTPGGAHFLVDSGPRYALRKDQPIAIKVGERTVTQALLALGARDLDALIVTSADSGCAGGAGAIIRNPSFTIDTIHHALPFNQLNGDETTDDILNMLKDPVLFQSNRRRRSDLSAWAVQDLFQAAQVRNIPMVPVKFGSIIHSEVVEYDGERLNLEIKVLNPPEPRYSGRYSTGSNSIVLQVDFGDRRVLLTSMIDKTAQSGILDAGGHFADVVQMPSNGARYAHDDAFIGNAKAVAVAPLPSRYAQKSLSGILAALQNKGIATFSTADSGALTITTDGKNLVIDPLQADPEVILP